MTLIVCVDDNFGMMFNNRRQSQDKLVREHILSGIDTRLWMNCYSFEQFRSEATDKIFKDDDFLNKISFNDSCFIENIKPSEIQSKTDKLILYKWNRIYPSDFYFDIDLNSWKLCETKDFKGFSHLKITREVYRK